MIDLISTNLTEEEKLIVEEFKAFTAGVISNEQIDEANKLRKSLGNKIETFPNHHWIMLVCIAGLSASANFRGMGLDKIKYFAVIQDPVAREGAYGLKALINSMDDMDQWVCNSGLVVEGYLSNGLVSSVATVNFPANHKQFDEAYNHFKPHVEAHIMKHHKPLVDADMHERCRQQLPESDGMIPITKEGVRAAMKDLVAFMFNHPSFTIC